MGEDRKRTLDDLYNGTEVLRHDVWQVVALLGLDDRRRGQVLDRLSKERPAWFKTLTFRAAAMVGFAELKKVSAVDIVRIGDVVIRDPANETFRVVITPLGREMLKRNPVRSFE